VKTILVLFVLLAIIAGCNRNDDATQTPTPTSVATEKIQPADSYPVLKNRDCHDTEYDCTIEYVDSKTHKKRKMAVRQFWMNNTVLYGRQGRPASFEYFITLFVPKSYDLKKANKATNGSGYNLSFTNVGPIKRTYQKGQERFVYGFREHPNGLTDTIPASEGYILLN